MTKSMRTRESKFEIRRYFVDEGGDSTLFASKGKVIVETPGCSRFFILGLLDVLDPAGLQDAFDDLRARLMNDSYFKVVPPSMLANDSSCISC